jgi:hypothetical protein
VGLAATLAFLLRVRCFFVVLMVTPRARNRTFSNLWMLVYSLALET